MKYYIKYSVGKYLRRSPVLYRFYCYIMGRNIEFPNSKTHLHVTGYPRSANTIISSIFKELINNERVTSHIHTIADLKMAKNNDVDTIVMIRNPIEAISSSVVKRRAEMKLDKGIEINFEDKINKELSYIKCKMYIDYYSYVLKNRSCFTIGIFSEALNDTSNFVKKTLEKIDRKKFYDREKIEYAKNKYVDKKKNSENEMKERRGVPSKDKEVKKDKVKRVISSMNCYRDCKKVFYKIVK